LTGSLLLVNTIGIVDVATLAANGGGVTASRHNEGKARQLLIGLLGPLAENPKGV